MEGGAEKNLNLQSVNVKLLELLKKELKSDGGQMGKVPQREQNGVNGNSVERRS